jgi:hypothetical protein
MWFDRLLLFKDQFKNTWFKFDSKMYLNTDENLHAAVEELTRRSRGNEPSSVRHVHPPGVRADNPLKL